ncbi:MAG TPA: agmatine deiminase family protein, partial [Flavobacteriales bacterium]|nr:agmatine deiminase family protein [Flavobacteriales bacterium]
AAFAQHGLPHVLAPQEVERIPAYRDSRAGLHRGIETPPDVPVRTMAEWEEIQSLVICWTDYTGILKQIVRYAKDECEVIIVCTDPNAVIDQLEDNSYGGPMGLGNITFLQAPFNSIWMRDYGAETIYTNEVDSLFLLDWIYNRPRPDDDVLPDAIAASKGIGVYSTAQAPNDLVHTGGNFMCDGAGTAFSSELVLDENGPAGEFNQTIKDEAQVDALMALWMGITPGRYIKMTTLPFDGIHHIDMHMKLLDEETLLVGEFPAGESDGPQLELNVQDVLDHNTSVFGTPYHVVRIPMPSSTGGQFPPNASYRTYANNVFINRTVLVPTYRTEYDSIGLRILREELPGYRVIGIDCDNADMNIISASGAIHCITKSIGVADPLLIRHQPLSDTDNSIDPYAVNAYIRHRSGIANATLYWTTDTAQGYAAVPMAAVDANGNWQGFIPAQPAGTVVFYYIGATANSGKVQVRPIVAPEGQWQFRVNGPTGILESSAPVVVALYPNPATDVVVLALSEGQGLATVTLHDALGRTVKRYTAQAVPAGGRLFLDVSSVPAGAYELVVERSEGRTPLRFTKQ